MVGGEKQAFEACRGLFKALAEGFIYLGPSGSGSKAKLASNLIIGINRLALAEGLVFAQTLGLEPRSFLALLKQTPAYSRAMDVKGEKMIAGDFTPESRIQQHSKDLDIILEYARRHAQPLPLARLHKDILTAAIEAGDGGLDTCAVIQQIRRMAEDTAGSEDDDPT